MPDFKPQCMKCGSKHFFYEKCFSAAPVYQSDSVGTETSGREPLLECAGCERLRSKVADLERRLGLRSEKKRVYQREYMRKRRAAFREDDIEPSDDVIALKLNTL